MPGTVVTVTLNPCIDKTIVLERLKQCELNRAKSTRTDPGGKGINVAKVLKTVSGGLTATGFLAGNQGRWILESLTEAGIPADFLAVPGETRTNLKIVDESADSITEINESGFPVSEESIAGLTHRFEGLMKNASIAVLSGSLPPGAPDTIYCDLIKIARKSGVKTILDCDRGALRKGLTALPAAVKPNVRELELLAGRSLKNTDEILSAVKGLIGAGVETVIVSMGADGAVAADKDCAYKTFPFDIEIKSPTGAGDSMVAAMAWGILSGMPLFEMAKFATAAGTLTASLPGTRLCSLKDACRYADSVRAVRL